MLTPPNLERLRAALRAQVEQRRSGLGHDTEALTRQLAALGRDIDRAAENFLRAPAELLGVIGEKLSAMKRQRDHLREQLRQAEAAERPQDVAAEVEMAIGHLWRLGEDMAKAEPARRREAFRQLPHRPAIR